jgi:hypothetical protein
MKTIIRLFIILSIALGISGVTLGAVNASGTGTAQTFEAGRVGSAPIGSGLTGQALAGFEHGGFSSRSSKLNGGIFSLGETLKNIGIVVVFVLVVALIENQLKQTRGERRAIPVPVSNEQPGRKE